MESLHFNGVFFTHPPDALYHIRKLYNLEKPGRMKEAIDILEEWIQKQEHFVSKKFDRDYLETLIISCKGSLEKTKMKLDKMCTLRTMMPEFFGYCELMEIKLGRKLTRYAAMPDLTSDYYRVYVMQMLPGPYGSDDNLNIVRDWIISFEALLKYDYNAGVATVLDLRGTSIKDVLGMANITILHSFTSAFIAGYAVQIKGIHFMSNSKLIETLVGLVKPMLPTKISSRIHIHKNLESLYEIIPKKYLCAELRGAQPSLVTLDAERVKTISSEKHINYMKEVIQNKTDESKRIGGKMSIDYLPGTFRSLNVD